MIFDKSTCNFASYRIHNRELFNQLPDGDFKGLGLQFYRAPLDNDMYINKIWEKFRLDKTYVINSGCTHNVQSDCLKISFKSTVKTAVKAKVAAVQVTYSVYGDGTIKADYTVLSGGRVVMIPRFGVQLELKKEFDRVKYIGLGPVVNLPDFREHALTGIYENTVDSMYENYIMPQESATRCNTRLAQVTDENGIGLRFDAVNKPFAFSAAPFTPWQCAKAKHREDLTDHTTCINLDAEVMGAGSNACGPQPDKSYCLGKLKGKSFSFVMIPVLGRVDSEEE